MKGVLLKGGVCSGHPPYPPRVSTTGSTNVFINDKAVHRMGDKWEVHCYDGKCHDGVLVSASNSVFVNGKGVGRVGDSISCGSVSVSGSKNVLCG